MTLGSIRAALSRHLQLKSFLLGAVAATAFLGFAQSAGAIDFGAIAKSATSLLRIKKNLDGDVKSLSGDAKTLFDDKENLLQIKEQLVKLATETQTQIDSINKLVGTVEGHVKTTEGDISKTSSHVNEIDDVRKALEGK
jgi:hypothetical protein